ncbi:hypothetical protein ILUMI_18725, partial [Ignelater luminosus]
REYTRTSKDNNNPTSAAECRELVNLSDTNKENTPNIPDIVPTSKKIENIISENKVTLSPVELRPYPKYTPKTTKRDRKREKLKILTKTPEKNIIENEYLEMQKKKKEQKMSDEHWSDLQNCVVSTYNLELIA